MPYVPPAKDLFSDRTEDGDEAARAKIVDKILALLGEVEPYNRQKALVATFQEFKNSVAQSVVDGMSTRWQEQESYDKHLGILQRLQEYGPGKNDPDSQFQKAIDEMLAHPIRQESPEPTMSEDMTYDMSILARRLAYGPPAPSGSDEVDEKVREAALRVCEHLGLLMDES